MKKIFQKWLLIVVSTAFLLTTFLSWHIASVQSRNGAEDYLRIKIRDAQHEIKHTQENLQKIYEMDSLNSIACANSLAKIIDANPSIIKNAKKMEEIKRDLHIEELHVSDAQGILICSVPHEYEGYDMKSSPQSVVFLGAVKDPKFQMWQRPMPNGRKHKNMSYAGVARLDRPGIVQVGYSAETLEKEKKLADINYIASTFRIGKKGRLSITNAPSTTEEAERFFSETVNGLPSLCISVPCGKYLLTGSYPEDEIYSSRNKMIWFLLGVNLVLFIGVYITIAILIQKFVVKDIYSINESLEKITNGNLEEEIHIDNTPEFKSLSEDINATVLALKQSIENEAKRIDEELEAGRKIQISVLPDDFPENEKFRFAARMYAAREVGGDFYDFFMIDNHRLAILVADVSGKGLTAALYMMGAKALLKENLLSGNAPEAAIALANSKLCSNNKTAMFLTAFVAILDLETGILSCVNAGHNPPLLKHKDGTCEYLHIQHSFALGIIDKAEYTTIPVELQRGDRLLLYTDGVTEAKNIENKLFGEELLQEEFRAMEGTPSEIIDQLKAKVENHSTGVPQSDDITMVIIEYKDSEPTIHIKQ